MTSAEALKTRPGLSRGQAIERARTLAEDLRPYVDEAERIRRLPSAAVDAMMSSGLMPLVRSAHFGGYGLDWITHVDCVSQVAQVSASLGWCFSFLLQHQFVLGLFHPDAQEYVYGLHPDPKIVTSFMPAGKAEATNGGFRLSGRWTFGSGGDHCDWAIIGGMVREPNAGPRWFLLKPGQFKIVDTWHSVGLKGTGSNDIVVEDALVADDFTVEMGPVYTGQSPGAKLLKEPIYRASLGSQFQFALLAPMLGAARGALESFVEFSRDRTTGMVPTKVSENAQILARIGESSGEIEAAHAILDKVSRGVWSGELAAPTSSAQVGRDFATTTKLLVQATDRLFAVVGARGLNEGNAVGRHWRDLHAIASHAALQTDGLFQTFGKSTFAGPSIPAAFAKQPANFRSNPMAADGVWKITVNSPMGAQESTWRLSTNGTALEGSSEGGPGGKVEAQNGKADNGHLTWSARITAPFPMMLEFDVTVEGDSMVGQVKAGSFGHSPLRGVRVG